MNLRAANLPGFTASRSGATDKSSSRSLARYWAVSACREAMTDSSVTSPYLLAILDGLR